MLDQLTKIVEQFTQKEVAANAQIDNNLAGSVAKETGNSLVDGLKSAVSRGNISDLMGMAGNLDVSSLTSNPVVKNIIDSLSNKLSTNVGLDAGTASGFAGSVIPQILTTVVESVKNGNFNIGELMGSGGLTAALDQNGDGKLGMDDAMDAIKKGGFGDLLGGFFKK